MITRPKIPIPMGGGLDRDSGLLVTNVSTMEDLRNVHLLPGRLEGRKGLLRAAVFPAGYVLLNVHPVRSRSMAAYLLRRPDGRLSLWASAADGSGVTALVDIPAVGVTGIQRYVLADIYDKLFIAHDEPDFPLRQPTRYWDFRTNTLHVLTILPASGPAIPIRFRGVADHLAFMLGWGWGAPGNEDGPETLRISLDGDPTTFNLQHYFLVGIRGEPIIGGGKVGKLWAIRKTTHGHLLVGANRATFGVESVEDHIGLPVHALGVSVSGTYYFWSDGGPRRSTGGPSEDLSPGLRLLDLAPDVLAVVDTETGFAAYDPTRHEVLFVFGQWAFVFHTAANPERWSYRQYGVALSCGAVLWESSTGTLVVPPDPAFLLTLGAPPVSTTSTVLYSPVTFAGPHDGTEHIELWGRNPVDTAWVRLQDVLIPGTLVVMLASAGLRPGYPYDLAFRITRSGAAQATSVSADPLDWPAPAIQMAVQLCLDDPVDDGSFVGDAFGAPGISQFHCLLLLEPSDQSQHDLKYEFEVDAGAGYVPLNGIWDGVAFVNFAYADDAGYVTTALNVMITPLVEPYHGTTIAIRVRRTNAYTSSAWLVFPAVVVPA